MVSSHPRSMEVMMYALSIFSYKMLTGTAAKNQPQKAQYYLQEYSCLNTLSMFNSALNWPEIDVQHPKFPRSAWEGQGTSPAIPFHFFITCSL